jgi:hypothetical protein
VHEEIPLLPLEGYATRRNVWMVTLDVAPSAPAFVAVVDVNGGSLTSEAPGTPYGLGVLPTEVVNG